MPHSPSAPLPADELLTNTPEIEARCGIDTVEIARIERLLRETPEADLARLFSADELRDAGEGPGRAASLAARFAAKEACLKLFPRETALGKLGQADFAVARDNYGAPRVLCSPAALDVLARNRVAAIAISLTHDRTSASAVAIAEPARARVSTAGKLLYHLLPIRRGVIRENLRRVYGDALPDEEVTRLAQSHYGHLGRLALEFLRFSFVPAATRAALVRVENIHSLEAALYAGQGRAGAHGPLRQLGSGDRCRAGQLSAGARAILFRAASVQTTLA